MQDIPTSTVDFTGPPGKHADDALHQPVQRAIRPPDAGSGAQRSEAACLQTFPREFIFFGSLSSMAVQVGNAVPVLLARRVGDTINTHLASNAQQVAP